MKQPTKEIGPPDCVCCEYMKICSNDIQKVDYCPDPHLNGVKDDNRFENLMLLTNSDHNKMKNEAIYQTGVKEGRRQVLKELSVR